LRRRAGVHGLEERKQPGAFSTRGPCGVGLFVITTSGRCVASSATASWMPSKTALPAIGARIVAASKARRSRAASS